MITELTDMRDRWRRPTGYLVGDNVRVSHLLVAKAAFYLRACQTTQIKSDARKLASLRGIAFSKSRSNGRITRKPRMCVNAK